MTFVRFLSGLLVLLLLPFAVYNSYVGITWAYEHAFVNLSHWARDGWARADAEITLPMQITYFTVWVLPPLFGLITIIGAIVTFYTIARGQVFSPRIGKAVRWLGAGVFLSAAAQLFGWGMSPVVTSWSNADGVQGFRFVYDSAQIGLMFCGLSFWIIGHIMYLAVSVTYETGKFR
jgi:hypothetical protein